MPHRAYHSGTRPGLDICRTLCVSINHYKPRSLFFSMAQISYLYIYFSCLRCRVRQPRAEKEEAFTASARLVQTSHLIAGTYSRWGVPRGR
jgi:hypothetical protein